MNLNFDYLLLKDISDCHRSALEEVIKPEKCFSSNRIMHVGPSIPLVSLVYHQRDSCVQSWLGSANVISLKETQRVSEFDSSI